MVSGWRSMNSRWVVNLQENDVFTIEPGLYYKGIGGVRLEDLVVVQKDHPRNLNCYPKFLEI